MNIPPEIVLHIVGYYCKQVISAPIYRYENVLMWCDKCQSKHYERVKVERGEKKEVIAGDLTSAKTLREVSVTFARAYGIAYMIENIGADFGQVEYVRVIRANSYFARKYLITLHARCQVDLLNKRTLVGFRVENSVIRISILPVIEKEPILIYDTDSLSKLYDDQIESYVACDITARGRCHVDRFNEYLENVYVDDEPLYPESLQPSGAVNFHTVGTGRTIAALAFINQR
jgi:hypothetical protein